MGKIFFWHTKRRRKKERQKKREREKRLTFVA
jgi:hypothetical protein